MRRLLAALLLLPALAFGAESPAYLGYTISGSAAVPGVSGSRTCNRPSTVDVVPQAGDLDVVFVTMVEDATVASTSFNVPAGFTELFQVYTTTHDNDVRALLHYKVRVDGASEPTTWTYGDGSIDGYIKCTWHLFRPANADDVWDVAYVEGDHMADNFNALVSGTPTTWNPAKVPRPVTTITNDSVVMLFQYMSATGTGWGPPTGYTMVHESASTRRGYIVALKTMATAGLETPGPWTHTGQAVGTDSLDFTLVLKAVAADSNDALLRRRNR